MTGTTIAGTVTILLMIGSLLVDPANADATDEVWLAELTKQALEAQNCDVAFYQRPREYTLAGVTVQEARINCLDRRQFDARRELPELQFTFEDCAPVLC